MGRAAAIAFARGRRRPRLLLPHREAGCAPGRRAEPRRRPERVPLPGDIRDDAFCKKMVADAASGLGGLDILVGNAGRQQSRESTLDIPDEDFDATMKTSIYASFWITREALPHMPPASTIVATTSEQAYDPPPDLYDYAQIKAATMNSSSRSPSVSPPKSVRVNSVAPGRIWTPPQVSGGATQTKLEKFGGQTALGRPGHPAELASIYVQLAAADAN